MVASLSPCSNCSAFGSVQGIGSVPSHLSLARRSFVRDPSTGSRLDRYTCADCGTNWLVEVDASDGIIDWYQAE